MLKFCFYELQGVQKDNKHTNHTKYKFIKRHKNNICTHFNILVSFSTLFPELPSPASLDKSLLFSAFSSLIRRSVGLALITALFLIFFALMHEQKYKLVNLS